MNECSDAEDEAIQEERDLLILALRSVLKHNYIYEEHIRWAEIWKFLRVPLPRNAIQEQAKRDVMCCGKILGASPEYAAGDLNRVRSATAQLTASYGIVPTA